MKLLRIHGIFTACFLLFLTDAYPAEHYIRSDANGANNGSNWKDAWTSLPAGNMFVRGDIYFIADGVYGAQKFGTEASGKSLIIVKKATVSDHGTDIGWDDSYGDGAAEFSGSQFTWLISSDYWIIDGVTGSGKSGHGFRLTTTGTTSASKLIVISEGVDHVEISHVNGKHAGMNTGYKQDCIYAIASTIPITHLTISHCYFHDVTRVHVLANNVTNSVFEHNYFENRYDSSVHGESFSMNGCTASSQNIIRYNVFKDIYGTGYIVCKDSNQGGFKIFGNLFYSTASDIYYATNGLICNTGGDSNSNMLVYNNTIYNIRSNAKGGDLKLTYWSGSGTGNVTKNNLVYGCGAVGLTGTDNYDYNAADKSADSFFAACNVTLTSDPFINSSGEDFRLKDGAQVINKGKNLGKPYNYDLKGTERPSSGEWDIGAYEYSDGDAPAPIPSIDTAIIKHALLE